MQDQLFDCMSGYSRKTFRMLKKTRMDGLDEIHNMLSVLPLSCKSDAHLVSATGVWCRIQIALLDMIMDRDETVNNMLHDFEQMEEENSLLRDFVDQHSSFSPQRKVEIQVKQIVRKPSFVKPDTLEKQTDTADLPADDRVPSQHNLNRAASAVGSGEDGLAAQRSDSNLLMLSQKRAQMSKRDKQIQTDPVEFADEDSDARVLHEMVMNPAIPDLFDKASGTDRPIPTFRTASVFADLPHPIEAKYADLNNVYQKLLQEKESAGIMSDHSLAELKAMYEGQLANLRETTSQQIKSLESAKEDLEKALLKCEDEAREYEYEKGRHAMETNELQLQITYFRREVDGLRHIEATLQRENETFKHRIKVAQGDARLAESRIAALTAEVGEQKDANVLLTKRQEETASTLAETERERKEYARALKETEDAHTLLKAHMVQLKEHVAEIETVNAELATSAEMQSTSGKWSRARTRSWRRSLAS
ncbi:hypothetical protein BC831DRAFT_306690 [Entophlyctis helioformis]|nr:hypothetical protein BC831DRAFT_306690 [Entophlyctis helioformis]